tara:strand:+ start:4581 stop:5111 length:531 start_codon:yes stop_codon:yes gene_type:complete
LGLDLSKEKERYVYLGIGGNLGDRVSILSNSLTAIQERIGTIEHRSSLYETPPWGYTQQPKFLNAAVAAKTNLPALEILGIAKELEQAAGRVSDQPRWHERPLDIDILIVEGEVIDSEELTVPHIYMATRAFVLVPLAEIAPEIVHQTIGLRIETLRDLCPPSERLTIKRYPTPDW